MKLGELDRNDVDAALAYAEERMDDGGLGDDEGHVLYMLQDDSTELMRRLGELITKREKAGLPT